MDQEKKPLSFRRPTEENPYDLGDMKRFYTQRKFEIDGQLDTRFFKGVVPLQDRGMNLTFIEQAYEGIKFKIINQNFRSDKREQKDKRCY